MGRSDVAWGEVWGFLFYWADELRWVGRDCRDSLLCGVVEGWLLFYWADELKKLGGLSYPATAQDGSGAAFGLLG